MRLPIRLIKALFAAIALNAMAINAHAAETPPGAAIASAHPAATAAGLRILSNGGNAFDAAIAVSAALAVVEPQSSGLGGGGFWLLHRAADGLDTMIDGRETAPSAATADMYLDEDGKYVRNLSRDGALAAGIPGEAAALDYIAKHYGKLPLAQSLAPAISLARDGFEVDARLSLFMGFRTDVLAKFDTTSTTFLNANGEALAEGAILKQPELAATLEKLAAEGRSGFYEGSIAQQMVDGVQSVGGIWRMQDLAEYQVLERKPVRFKFKNYDVVSAAPPSSGGVVLAEALQIIEGFPWAPMSKVDRKHVTVEAMRRAYRDRAAYLGDPDFVKMPLSLLTSPEYAAGMSTSIRIDRATASSELAPPGAEATEGNDTTHFSILDSAGNRVAATLSINYPFGSGYMAPGTGVILNNEMDDFSAKPLTPNGYGLIGAGANAIAPGKRPLSSMSPTFIEGPDRIGVIGTPGGSRIISMVLLGILAFDEGIPASEIVGLPRYHHQYQPDQILYEPAALRESEKRALASKGHQIKLSDREYGNMQVVIWNKKTNTLDAASDPRGVGEATIQR